MSQHLVHPNDVEATTGAKRDRSSTELYDCDGNFLAEISGRLSDQQVRDIIAFANDAFGKGFDVGQSRKAREIRLALDIEDARP